MIYKLVTRVIQYFCFPNRPMEGGEISNFSKGGNLRKWGYDPPKCKLLLKVNYFVSDGGKGLI